MPQIKMEYTVDLDDELAKIFEEGDRELRCQLMAGAMISDLPTKEALTCLFASFGAVCDERHLNKGKILFDWSERFDKLEAEGF